MKSFIAIFSTILIFTDLIFAQMVLNRDTSLLFEEKESFLDLSSNISSSGAKLVLINIFFSSFIIPPLGTAIIILDIILGFYIWKSKKTIKN